MLRSARCGTAVKTDQRGHLERTHIKRVCGRQSEIVAEGADVRVTIVTLVAGDSVPWHYRSEITDDMVGMEGTTVVETRAPRNTYVLEPGQRCTIGPKTAHCVHGKDGGAADTWSCRAWGSTTSCQ